MLGGDECTQALSTEEDLVSLLETLKEAKPRFRFSTNSPDPTAEYPTPRTFQKWLGTRGIEEANGVPAVASGATPASADTADQTGEVSDLGSLAEAADQNDEAAIDQLVKLALELGFSQKQINAAKTYSDLAEEMAERQESAQSEPPAEDDTPQGTSPVKGETYNYTPPKAKAAVKCQVMSVNMKEETVTLKNLVRAGIQYKDVPWSDLET
jgi:hypothetical protein